MSRWWPLIGLTLLAACAPDEPASDNGDPSAGDPSVVQTDATSAALWRIEAECSLELGRDADVAEQQFDRIRAAFRLRDGRVGVADGGTNQIRYFAPTGEHLMTAGGRGNGPGEFARFTNVVRAGGDSLLVYDQSNARLTLLGPDGHVAGMRSTQDLPELRGGAVIGMLADQVVYQDMGWPPLDVPDTYGRDTIDIRMVPFDQPESRLLASVPSMERYFEAGRNAPGSIYDIPFGYQADRALWQGTLVFGTEERYELTVLDPADTSSWTIRRTDRPSLPISDPMVAEYVADAERELSSSMLLDAMHAQLDLLAPEHTIPSYRGMLVSGDGHLWVRDFFSGRPGREERADRWTVFGPDGRIVAVAQTPVGMEVLDVTGPEIVGLMRTDFDVQYVQVCGVRA